MKIIDSYVTLGRERDLALSTERLLSDMDKVGCDQAVIFPDDRERAVQNLQGNERILIESARHADRLIPGFSVNPWFGEEGETFANEARNRGSRILLIDPIVQGFLLVDPLADWLWKWAEKTRTPVHVRASPSASSNPAQVWFLARKFPRVQWVLGGGGTTDYVYDLLSAVRAAPDNLWFEIGTMRSSAVNDLLADANKLRLLFGSSAPRQQFEFEYSRMKALVPKEACSDVFSCNLERLLA